MVFGLKSELKWMRYHQNTENPNKNLHFLKEKLVVFNLTLRNKLYRLGKN